MDPKGSIPLWVVDMMKRKAADFVVRLRKEVVDLKVYILNTDTLLIQNYRPSRIVHCVNNVRYLLSIHARMS